MDDSGGGRYRCPGTRLTVEDCLSLSIVTLRKHGLLSGQGAGQRFTWRDEQGEIVSSVNVVVDMEHEPSPSARFRYTVRSDEVLHDVDLRVALTPTPTRHEGRRWWYACPACKRRAGVLHLPPGEKIFACRSCHDLSYRSRWRGHKDTIAY
ncbi:MAG: hypothetical protein H8E44_41260 [Planctomycetes bacterium]|nr:hypothetical protein [Planctomycetota bacterium]